MCAARQPCWKSKPFCEHENNMSITPRDIGTYFVESRSTPEEGPHIVDANELTCSCRAFENRKRLGITLCAHLLAVVAQRRTRPAVSLLDEASPLLLTKL